MRVGSLAFAVLVGWLTGCSNPRTAAIQGPEKVVITDTRLTRIEAVAVDAAGQRLVDVPVAIAQNGDPMVLKVGNNGEVQCQRFGRVTLMLAAEGIEHPVQVACLLVGEVRGAPQRLVTILDVDADGAPIPKPLGAYQFQALDFDGKAIPDAPISVTTGSEGVLAQSAEGVFAAVKPGRAVLTGAVGGSSAQIEVEVGLLVALRKAETIPDGGHLGIPVAAGRYRVAVGASEPVVVGVRGGACDAHEAAQSVEPICNLDVGGTIRIENPGLTRLGPAAQATVRVVAIP